MHRAHPYDALTPDVILDAVETCGVRATGGLLALNSYENRVYRVEIEEQSPRVVKFYRPNRWSDPAILEEHSFVQGLAEQEIPAVAPQVCGTSGTLSHHAGFRFAVFPWQPGRAPELNTAADRELLGRFLGRLHRAGSAEPFLHRPRLTVEDFGRHSVSFLVNSHFIPEELRESFRAISEILLHSIEAAFAAATGVRWIRLHGDCHLGNVLWNQNGPYFVDFDDCLMGPAVQDLWMLLSGDRVDMEQQLAHVLTGYTQFMDFDPAELRLIESLRALRILRYNAWIGLRWDDPAFPHNFPWFDTRRFWEEQILTLRQQAALLDEPALSWSPQYG
jgi:Ser/Thr protein kinase RdoA (MazF antagonist)